MISFLCFSLFKYMNNYSYFNTFIIRCQAFWRYFSKFFLTDVNFKRDPPQFLCGKFLLAMRTVANTRPFFRPFFLQTDGVYSRVEKIPRARSAAATKKNARGKNFPRSVCDFVFCRVKKRANGDVFRLRRKAHDFSYSVPSFFERQKICSARQSRFPDKRT